MQRQIMQLKPKTASDLNPNIKVFEISKDSYAEGKWYLEIDDSKVQIKQNLLFYPSFLHLK